jgi:hypothetical protein
MSRMKVYFEYVRVLGVKYGQCKYQDCYANKNWITRTDGNTKSLWRHLASAHPDDHKKEEAIKETIKKESDEKKKKLEEANAFVFKPVEPKASLMSQHFKVATKYPKAHPAQKRFDRNLKNYMVHEGAPFNTADKPFFKKLVAGLDPRVHVFGRKKYTKEIHREGKVVKRRAKQHVEKYVHGGMAATADGWRSKAGDEYMGINNHFIDVSWRMQKIVVACKPFKKAHSGENIKNLLDEEADQIKLSEDTSKFNVTDTAADMLLGRKQKDVCNVSCCNHKLQLVVEDANKEIGNEDVEEALSAAKALVKFSHQSGPFHRGMKKYCRQNGHRFTKLTSAVSTRWNSQLEMVESCLKHRECLHGMEIAGTVPNMPTIETADWRLLKQVAKLLQPFKWTTKVWESDERPTMSTVGVELYNLEEELEEVIEKENKIFIGEGRSETPTVKYARSLHSALQRRFPQLGMDSDPAAWGNLLNPLQKVGLGNKSSLILFAGPAPKGTRDVREDSGAPAALARILGQPAEAQGEHVRGGGGGGAGGGDGGGERGDRHPEAQEKEIFIWRTGGGRGAARRGGGRRAAGWRAYQRALHLRPAGGAGRGRQHPRILPAARVAAAPDVQGRQEDSRGAVRQL